MVKRGERKKQAKSTVSLVILMAARSELFIFGTLQGLGPQAKLLHFSSLRPGEVPRLNVQHCYNIRKQILRISKLPTVTSIFSFLDYNFSSISHGTAAPSLIQPRKIHLQVEDHQRGRLSGWHNVNFDTSPHGKINISIILGGEKKKEKKKSA